MMKIAFVGFSYLNSSGITRATLNLAKGLTRAGVEVEIYCLTISDQWNEVAKRCNIKVHTMDSRPPLFDIRSYLHSMLDTNLWLARKLDKVVGNCEADFFVLSDDCALSFVTMKRNRRFILWTHGDMSMLLLSSSWKATTFRKLSSLMFPHVLFVHRRYAQQFDYVLANSRLARELAQFTYELVPDGILYPPTDTDRFRPVPNPTSDYVFAIGRPLGEGSEELLELLAQKVHVVTAGGLNVRGAKNMGYIDNDETLSVLYSNALVTLHATTGEYFGYAVAESLACGTPVCAMNVGGPSEMIDNEKNGWLFVRRNDVYNKIISLSKEKYDASIRTNCVESMKDLSIDAVTNRFLQHIHHFG